ncbi:hypothetical protein LNL84_07705 [Vibrio sp. ZSDZ34]|jgi:hypothetical protein|uniref:Uncharacterized protein n=1 Tax=Vibrio gelatinilyticus TaxID=2893468 RepID=A0A9X2AW11_9VIBR|nr:hypothetical protein [Vibrio gelatinilyticus]MCJ2376721.1 hypothetical protein [Vibrio gelatinilyticus]
MELFVPSVNWESAFARFYQDFVQNDIDNANYYREGVSNFAGYWIDCNR